MSTRELPTDFTDEQWHDACELVKRLIAHGFVFDVERRPGGAIRLSTIWRNDDKPENLAAFETEIMGSQDALILMVLTAEFVEQGRIQLLGGRQETVEAVTRVMWARKSAGVSRIAKSKTSCDHCGRIYRPKKGRTLCVHYTVRVNFRTGKPTPVDHWYDYCSKACHDAMLRGDGDVNVKFIPGADIHDEETRKRIIASMVATSRATVN